MAVFAKDMTAEQMLGEAERLENLAAKWEADAQLLLDMKTPSREVRRANIERAVEHKKHAANALASAGGYRLLAAG